jgi:hypothetical protein
MNGEHHGFLLEHDTRTLASMCHWLASCCRSSEQPTLQNFVRALGEGVTSSIQPTPELRIAVARLCLAGGDPETADAMIAPIARPLGAHPAVARVLADIVRARRATQPCRFDLEIDPDDQDEITLPSRTMDRPSSVGLGARRNM